MCIGFKSPLAFICGPCVIESLDHTLKAAESLKQIFSDAGIPFVFKSSYDKANRSSFHSFRGPGIDEGLEILAQVQKEFDLPVVTDVHSPEEATKAGGVCDMIQIPAFLCRQTDLVVAAAQTNAVVSVKKGQFLAPWDMKNVVTKVEEAGSDRLLLVERGASFGYNNLVSDMRSIPIMQSLGYPVVFDATHSVQLPGGRGDTSGGQREFIPTLAKAAIAAGANALFMEAHPDPENAKSDAGSQMDMKALPKLLETLKKLYEIVNHA
ncbi:MAG: 3-deoxy-8-phosphooctulonate synthase [Chlamydiia bacterium]|nr:3-deoxy-8-phosphooctulonate synthase [Chlamydiia bacterium]